jgi:hypothetical protein
MRSRSSKELRSLRKMKHKHRNYGSFVEIVRVKELVFFNPEDKGNM